VVLVLLGQASLLLPAVVLDPLRARRR